MRNRNSISAICRSTKSLTQFHKNFLFIPSPHSSSRNFSPLFKNFFDFFKNFFKMCTFLRISLHYIYGAQKIRPAFGSEQVLHTYFAYLRYCTVPDCHSPGDRFSSVQIDDIFPFPLRGTRSFLMPRPGKMSGRNSFRPQYSATSILSFLMTPRCFFVIKRR